jgi:SNF2 family DNA or RNA helicase
LQREVVLHCCLSPYQATLYELVKSSLKDAEGSTARAKGINNTVMELRTICNHPFLRWVQWLSPFKVVDELC